MALTARDYSLTGEEAKRAVANGLAGAKWYASPIPRKRMKELMARSDGPALRDTALWLGLTVLVGALGIYTWGTWAAVPVFIVYGVLYGSASDSRWHECGHGTPFKTRWYNDVVYQIASFMVLKEPTVWRWSHSRHHTDTIIVGRDREIIAYRPPNFIEMFLDLFNISGGFQELRSIVRHAFGRLSEEEKGFIPEMEHGKVFVTARIYLAIYAAVIALSVFRKLAAADADRTAVILRRLAEVSVRCHPACRPCGRRARSPAEFTDDHDEPSLPLPVLEHELPCRAPHVPNGALPCPAQAA